MATLVLSAIGASIGASAGGAVLGISSAVIGRAIGATVGRVIDQRLLGGGSRSVETGRVDRFRLSSAGEGDPVERVYARMRVPGQVIWSTNFRETAGTTTTGGGKGGGSRVQTTTTEYRYSVSLALALCEGVATRVDRVWANGIEIAPESLSMRFHSGAPDQAPDPKIEAVEGTGTVPAYRGTAYVVIEDLDLGPYGNRVPQFAFEVLRPAQPEGAAAHPRDLVRGVALIPGTGEYSLATTPVHYAQGPGQNVSANVHSAKGEPDLEVALDALTEELPNCGSVALVVSWFGDNLKCGDCSVEPRVEQTAVDSPVMPWSVSGTARGAATAVSQVEGRPVYGGTPTDTSVIEAITALNARGKEVCFYPFILMDIQAGNGLGDPWTGAADQPVMPWRGRIGAAAAVGSAAADAEVAAFFGTASAADFAVTAGKVAYSGPAEWSFRRFILHYAALCVAAGGVESFLIGSEMRGLTQVRGQNGFPAVDALIDLAAEVRTLLGPGVRIGYAADWSEYFGYRPEDGSGDLFFHLDPLWADGNIDFIGIDNYMPISDWRDGAAHADAGWGTIYNPAYLAANVEGGEGFDWYYASDQARDRQIRTPIADTAHGEDWVFRYKDLRSWWRLEHHERIGGIRQATPTAWVPESKPIRFTELGCAAIDKGTNQPNVFLDAKSSESAVPYFSTRARDDLIQLQYLSATFGHWSDPANNPVSTQYAAPMIDLAHANVWAWDARPFPVFPNDTALWSDGPNYPRGHWISGRLGTETLARTVAEITERCGVSEYDVSALHGVVRGYHADRVQTGRADLQALMLAFGFDAVDRDGKIVFMPRAVGGVTYVTADMLAEGEGGSAPLQTVRAGPDGNAGRVRVQYIEAEGSYAPKVADATMAGGGRHDVEGTALPLVLTPAEAQATADRWMSETAVARDSIRFTLPPSQRTPGVGDVVAHESDGVVSHYRIERAETRNDRSFEAVRVEAGVYAPPVLPLSLAPLTPFVAPVPVAADFLELPLLSGSEDPIAPHLAVVADPWPGQVAVYSAATANGLALNTLVTASAAVGVTESALAAATPGLWDRSDGVVAGFVGGVPVSASEEDVLNGANLAAIGTGDPTAWEVFQFRDATLLTAGRYRLSGLLRGQAGSDAEMAASWAPGAKVVLLTGAVKQTLLSASARGLSRTYRIGDARVGPDHSTYSEQVLAFEGRGLRPLSPVHLRATRDSAGDDQLSWIRRTRVEGDGWEAPDVPLGEAFEAYDVRVTAGGSMVRSTTVTTPAFVYTAADRAADGVTGAYEVDVAQVSDRYGAGPYERMTVNG